MIQDLYNKPMEIEIGEKTYKVEFDNNAYAHLEGVTGKGLLNLYNIFIVENNLPYKECAEVVCAGLIKHHKKEEIELAREVVSNSPWVFAMNIDKIQQAFATPLIPPDVLKKFSASKKPAVKKKQSVKK